MKRLGRQLKSYRSQFVAVIRNEFRAIFTDEGALLILVFALFIYSTTYSLAYGPQVLRNVPIGVVDNSHTAASRRLTATFDAGPNAYVAYEPTDMEQARELFFNVGFTVSSTFRKITNGVCWTVSRPTWRFTSMPVIF